MKINRLVGVFVISLLLIGCSKSKKAQEAFENIKAEVDSGSAEAVVLALEYAYPNMREFLTIVDSGLVSQDEK